MKHVLFIVLCLLAATSSCSKKKKLINEEQQLKNANFNFTMLKRQYHKGLYFMLPAYFERDYVRDHMLKSDGFSRYSEALSMHFSVEHFSASEAENIHFAFPDVKTDQEAIQSHYLNQRCANLYTYSISINSLMPKGSRLDGYYHCVEGRTSEYDVDLMYFIGTLEKKIGGESHFYVVQMVCPPDVAAYMADDFRRTIKRAY